jgi:hypothetical protein
MTAVSDDFLKLRQLFNDSFSSGFYQAAFVRKRNKSGGALY